MLDGLLTDHLTICIFIHLKFISEQIRRATGLPLCTIVQNGPVTGYLMCKTGYPSATSWNQWICIFIHTKFISEQNRWATGLPLYSFVQNGLLMGFLLYRTGYLLKSMNLYFHSFEIHLWANWTGYHCTPLFKTGYLLYKTGYLLKSMNFYFHSFEIHLWANTTDYRATIVLLCLKRGYWRATYFVRKAARGLPFKINEFDFYSFLLSLRKRLTLKLLLFLKKSSVK